MGVVHFCYEKGKKKIKPNFLIVVSLIKDMKEFCVKHKRLLIDIAVLVGIFLFVFFSYLIFKPLYRISSVKFCTIDGVVPRIFIFLCILAIVLVGVILKFKNKLSIEKALFLVFLLGVVMQLNYMLITPIYPNAYYRQHDAWGDAGHEAYAWTLYTTGKLPTLTDETTGYLASQFYHPPFNALMQALFMHIAKPFMTLYNTMSGSAYYDVTNADCMYQTAEVLATFYMNIATYFAIRLVNKLKVNCKFRFVGAVFIALFPALMILAGQINNDTLCIMNCFIVIYYTACWWENKSYYNAIMIGLFTGLAMFAKLSGALIILPAIVAYAVSLVQSIIKKEKISHYFIQGGIIGVVAAPLGLWFHIYANVKYHQPFGYVWPITWDALYVGNHSFFDRFINIFDFQDLTLSLWGRTVYDTANNIPNNYNLPNFLIKSALFGEYSFMCAESLGVLALAFNYLFVYSSLILMIIYFVKSKKEHLEMKIIGGVIVLTQLLAQLYFNIKYPFGCTMDFRYIVPIILGFMILDVLAFDKFIQEKSWRKYYSLAVLIIGGLFITCITGFYLTAI